MILELAGCGVALYGVLYWKYYKHIQLKKKWNTLMHLDDATGKNTKVKPTYEILRIIDKEYGHDLIVSIPFGKSYEDLTKKKSEVENALCSKVQMRQSSSINSAYVRVIENVDKNEYLKFCLKWEQVMLKAGIKNSKDETFIIQKIIAQEKYGKDLEVKLVDGLTYKKLEDAIPVIESNFNCVTELEWKRFDGIGYLKMAEEDFDQKTPFVPVETKPYELYFGQTFFRENITADMTDMPHVLIEGATGSGKSRCFFIALTNLLYWHEDIDLYLAQTSDKKDLQKFAYVKQCKYFARDLQHTDQLVKYLLDIQKERNQILAKYGLDNIGDYNKKFPSKRMKYIYFCIDEFKSLNPPEEKTIDPQGYVIKSRIMYNLCNLIQESRSAGIFMILCIQRPDKASIPPQIKQYLNILVAFRANNKSTSKVMTDDERAWNLPNREAIFMGSTDKTMKTVFIDNAVIKKYLKNRIEENHEYVNIYEKKGEEQSKPKTKTIQFPEKEVAATMQSKNKGKGKVGIDGIPDFNR
jgi:S-DNA-T family DNA segregation ATPase FtsK/SpoIIIE